MNEYCVYCHTNLTNGKKYIGLTCNTRRRFHPYAYKQCPKFFPAIVKYGWDGFAHEILRDGLTKEEAQELERKLIAQYKTQSRKYGYNYLAGGEVGRKGIHYSVQERARMSVRRKGIGKGKHMSSATEFKKGHSFSEGAIEKMRQAKIGHTPWNKGRKQSEHHRFMNSQTSKGKVSSNRRRVAKYGVDGTFYGFFPSVSSANDSLGFGKHVSECCAGRLQTAGGFRWYYTDQLALIKV